MRRNAVVKSVLALLLLANAAEPELSEMLCADTEAIGYCGWSMSSAPDGSAGTPLLAVGAPAYEVGEYQDGAVVVYSSVGSDETTYTLFTHPTESGTLFGQDVAVSDSDCDSYPEVAIGAPWQDTPSYDGQGGLWIVDDDELSRCVIASCEGTNGWDNYLLLHHYDKSETIDAL